jgi:hypothetical protein
MSSPLIDVHQMVPSSGAAEGSSGREADAGACTGDDNDLVLQIFHPSRCPTAPLDASR